MTLFAVGEVTVEVPATSANLGPGYDCFGLALDLCDTITGEVRETGLSIEMEGEGATEVPRDESHLVVRAMHAAFEAMGVDAPGLRLSCRNRIPHCRGLGSSSAAIVGGIVLARELVRGGDALLSGESALALANRMEGHPDNVGPALLGGFVISGQAADEVWAERAPVDPAISVVVLVPPRGVRTDVARRLLPESVTHVDAASNTGRAALLVAALAGRPELLLRATEDFLHQSQREPAMPESLALVRDLRALGLAAVVSGAGPTVVVLVREGTDERDRVVANAPDGWQTRHHEVRNTGATVLM